MSHSAAEHDPIALLHQAGADWARLRPWIIEEVPIAERQGAVVVEGPALVYRWEEEGPVAVSLVTEGERPLSAGGARMLAIEVGRGTIRLHVPGRSPHVIGAIPPAIYQPIVDLVTEAQLAMNGGGDDWHHQLGFTGCAQRLPVLTFAAATSASGGERGSRRSPKKDQLVTQLHEWLRPNLENSVKLGDAAKRFDKSPRQLIRILKETTGAGFAEHLTMHRLTLARSLLMRTAHSVMEIARSSGFNSREQFIRSFSKSFGWTPLQFRKAWNRAALSDTDLVELCQVSERDAVKWLERGTPAASPEEGEGGEPHTVVVANALHEIVELFWVSPQGKPTRIDVLERGGMVFVNRDSGGSVWLVRAPGSGWERAFETPDAHALAVVAGGLRKG